VQLHIAEPADALYLANLLLDLQHQLEWSEGGAERDKLCYSDSKIGRHRRFVVHYFVTLFHICIFGCVNASVNCLFVHADMTRPSAGPRL